MKLADEKVFRDPIHGYIRVDDEVILKCIDTPEFQRLKRIRQLGSTVMVYSTGEHSRFSHSLGVYEIARRMVNEVADLKNGLSEHDKMVVKIAALLHDIGHAPFSHSFEAIMNSSHEEYTVQIILGPSGIRTALDEEDPTLAEEVASVINHTHPDERLCQLISSQLDADRMDYLLRDSYFTGTSYGQFDLERILRTMRVRDGRVVVKQTGMHTIEDYIMARYHMYWQVYFHPVSRSYDVLLRKVFRRLKDLYAIDKGIADRFPMYKPLLEQGRLSNDEYFKLDDSTCLYSFQLMTDHEDPILSDLASRILNRRLFEYTAKGSYEEYCQRCLDKGFDPEYYLETGIQTQKAYQPYNDYQGNCIWVLTENDDIEELSKVSKMVASISDLPSERDERLFYPKELDD